VLWPEVGGLLAPLPTDADLVAAGYLPDWEALPGAVVARARAALGAADLDPGRDPVVPAVNARDRVSPQRAELLATLQSVARADPEAVVW